MGRRETEYEETVRGKINLYEDVIIEYNGFSRFMEN